MEGAISKSMGSVLRSLYRCKRLPRLIRPSMWCRKIGRLYITKVQDLLFCKVGIKIEEDEWVWKSNTGSESNVEKDKGHVSDAFKRACVELGDRKIPLSVRLL